MKFRCERDTLVEALTTASRAVSPRSSPSATLMGIRVEAAGNRLTVVGTDLDLTMRVEIEAIGLDDGAMVAPARLAADIVRSLEPGAVTFEGDVDEVEISAARSRFVVRTYPVDDFPVLPEPRPDQVTMPAQALSEALRQVVRAASGDDARPLLTGVLVAA
ncbi:MAG: DNA polymerase III subunit beta, partial [Acidimicrobiales bacterium]